MNRIKILISSVILITLAGCSVKADEIVVCGDDRVLIIDKNSSDNENVNIIWQWKVSEAIDLPPAYQKYMIPTDECKPVDKNSKILITSSGGGVVLADRETKKTLFYAYAPMAHSAELLPGNRIVVALSTAEGGNRIELYDIKNPETVIFKDSLFSGHGVVWMPELERLFALGYDELRSYSLKGWDTESPELLLTEKHKLPEDGGHDLSKVTESKLILSTHEGVYTFNAQDKRFSAFGPLEGEHNIKSVNYNESRQRLIYTKGEISWWTHNIYCKNPDKIITIPDLNIYKARVLEN